ncbi:MAG: ATP-binding protein [Vicinamibacterales bacterium]
MRGTWQFIGREQLFRELSTHLLARREGARALGVVMVGEAGVGKTRMLTELVAAAAEAGFRCRLLQANSSTREVPLGCLAGVLSTHLAQDTRQASADVLFHRAVAALVSEADAADGRFLLAVDDLPELDGRSAAAIQQTLSATGCALVATARTDQPLPAALDALWREGWLEAVQVAPLPDAAMVALASASLGGALADRTALRLTQLAGGNPLNLREVMVSAQAAGAFHLHGAEWELDASFRPGPTLRAMVERRLGTATPAVRRVCELVALAEPIALGIPSSPRGRGRG